MLQNNSTLARDMRVRLWNGTSYCLFLGVVVMLERFSGRIAIATVFIGLIFCVPGLAGAQQASSITISGTVSEASGAPVAGANVSLRGPQSYTATTDPKGAFAFSNVTQGVYTLSVGKPGYNTAVQSDIVALAGQTQTLTVHIDRLTFSSLRTIADVRASGRGSINTSPASVSVVTTQTFVNQAQPQVTRVLNQIPGMQISFPSNSTNGASPGSITVPNIRAATAYETASLIDGHPISVGQYGDNVTSFLNSFMFGGVEVIKGPGADSPVVNNAIGGTTNFRTKDPTLTPLAEMLVGVDNRGGTLSNFSYSDTVGRFGFVMDLATNHDPSALNGKRFYYDPTGGLLNGGFVDANPTATQVGNTATQIPTRFPLLACCYTLLGNYDQTAELLKARYRVSPATSLTVSYLDSQTDSDQTGNTAAVIQAQFVPGAGYTGSLKPGPYTILSPASNFFAGSYNGEHNIEPIFQAEMSTTINNDTLLARFYHASILRYQFQGASNEPTVMPGALFGTSSNANGGIAATFNGQVENLGYNDLYQEPELDKLSGGSLQYRHPLANGDLTFSADRTVSASTDYSLFSGPFYEFNLPPGTGQILTTYMLRGHFYVGRRLDLTLSNYLNTYHFTYPAGCATDCNTLGPAVNGDGVIFNNTNLTHYDPRFALVYRPNTDIALRFSAGSSIAPPFLGLLSSVPSAPTYSGGAFALESEPNPNLRPETAFGWDIGSDVRMKDRITVASADFYFTNLFNRFFAQTVDTGLVCNATTQCASSGPIPPNTPILNQTNSNISNARFEGVELTVRRNPTAGFGYTFSGALQKGYYYNLPPDFYCSVPGPGCTMDQNLNIIAGQNTNGVGIFIPGKGFSYNGNMRIPYSQGNAELYYTFHNGLYASFGETYYGNNNSLGERAFHIGYATLRYPINEHIALQLSGDNIFNAYSGIMPIYGGGIPIPLADGSSAATIGNVLGPATYRLVLMSRLP
jgi:outer membrane receptor protein involved in Fe transport